MTDLRELEKRLEEATGPDRELDLAIGNIGAKWPWYFKDKHREVVTRDEYGPGAAGNPVCSLERYTASLDDAVARVETDAGRDDLKQIVKQACELWWSRPGYLSEELPRFVCLALIRALIAKGDRHD